MEKSPHISSFVLRFVQEKPSEDSASYRGTIRHVQTNQETSFTQWGEVTTFIQRFVALENFDTPRGALEDRA